MPVEVDFDGYIFGFNLELRVCGCYVGLTQTHVLRHRKTRKAMFINECELCNATWIVSYEPVEVEEKTNARR